MEAQRDPYTWILLQRSRLSAALLGFPIEINQRKIVSSPSEAFVPAAAVGRTDPSPLIKFLANLHFIIFTAALGLHYSLQDIFPSIFFRSFSLKNSTNQSRPVCQPVNLDPPPLLLPAVIKAIFSNLVNMLFLLYHNKLLQYHTWI